MEMNDDLKFIDEAFIKKLEKVASNRIDYWDLRCEASTGTNIDFTDQKSKEISSYDVYDCGIRTFINGGWGFLVLKDLNADSILKNFEKVIKLARLSESLTESKFKIKERDSYIKNFKIEGKKAFNNVDIEDKINLVKNHEKIASDYSKQIKNTRTLYYDGVADSIFLNSFGSFITQKLALARMFSVSYAQKNGVIQQGRNSIGGLGGFEIMETEKALNISKNSSKEAVELLDAISPKGGQFTVIMDPKLTGTFFHEFCHACEADHILNKESILEGKIGDQVANDNITLIDDPQIGNARELNLNYDFFGSYFVDDEGIPSQKTIIIEDGILKNYLHNIETASRINESCNGHGRAASSSSKPLVRMGVTVLETRDWTLEDMLSEVKNGILLSDFQYGYCDPSTGNFQYKSKISQEIKNGELTNLLRDVSLSGMALEILNRIKAVGNKKGYGDGMCGKGGQSIRVSDTSPYILVENVTVGGLGI